MPERPQASPLYSHSFVGHVCEQRACPRRTRSVAMSRRLHTHTHGEVAKDHNQRLLPLMSNPLTLVRLRNLSRVYDGFPGFQVLGLAWRHKMEKQIRDPSVPGSYHTQQTGVFVGLSPVCEPQAPSFRNRMKSANHHQNP